MATSVPACRSPPRDKRSHSDQAGAGFLFRARFSFGARVTKVRTPLSIDAALARIAGQVPGSWSALAGEVGYEERTVRKWGDVDADGEINVTAAIKLDILFQRHGGEGFPLHDAYGRMLGVAVTRRFHDQFEILRRVMRIAKETGDAEAALLRFALPDATDKHRAAAQREVLEALEAIQAVLPLVDANPLPTEEYSQAP